MLRRVISIVNVVKGRLVSFIGNRNPTAVHDDHRYVVHIKTDDPQVRDAPVRCQACQSRFAVGEFSRTDIERLDDCLHLQECAEWSVASIANYKEFKPLAQRYPVLKELTEPTYGRPIPIPPKLSVALAERIGRALTAEECEVLDRRQNRWFYYLHWKHNLSEVVDGLIDANRREISEMADRLDELHAERASCPHCSQNALTLDCRVEWVPLSDLIWIDSDQ